PSASSSSPAKAATHWPARSPPTEACCKASTCSTQNFSEARMPESISSARTSSPAIAEWLLARITDPTRAAAIMGDLTEMAATRGRAWFWTAYARTLVSFTWRIVLALFVADIGRQMIFDLFHLYIRHTPAAWRNATGSWLDLLNSSGPLLACILSTLWFVLPFAVLRYGRRD